MYEFDPRWPDDPRENDHGRELSQGSRGGLSDPRERASLDPRDVYATLADRTVAYGSRSARLNTFTR